MNAVRHGLAARASLLPGEDPAELDELTREMEADLRPRGAAQRELVGRIVSLSWRLRRLARAEETLWAEEDENRTAGHERWMRARIALGMAQQPWETDDYEAAPEPATGAQFLARQFSNARGTSPLERIAVYEQRLDRALHAAFRQFQQLRKMRDAEDAEDAGERADEAGRDDAPVVSAPQNEPTEDLRVKPRMASAEGAPISGDTVSLQSDAPTADPIRGFTLHAHANAQNEPTARNTAQLRRVRLRRTNPPMRPR